MIHPVFFFMILEIISGLHRISRPWKVFFALYAQKHDKNVELVCRLYVFKSWDQQQKQKTWVVFIFQYFLDSLALDLTTELLTVS